MHRIFSQIKHQTEAQGIRTLQKADCRDSNAPLTGHGQILRYVTAKKFLCGVKPPENQYSNIHGNHGFSVSWTKNLRQSRQLRFHHPVTDQELGALEW